MKKENKNRQTQELLDNSDYVILDNPLASPKFIRAIKRGEYQPLSLKDTYTPKLFYEIVSRINAGLLEGVTSNENIVIEVLTKEFAQNIGAISNSNFYADIKKVAEYLSDIKIDFKGLDGLNTRVGVVVKTKTDEKGKIVLYVDSELATRILEVKEKSNFSFLKSNLFKLQNGQAIRLYPFLKSWANHGKYVTDLERFKTQFGYDTSGYVKYSNLEKKVLIPAIGEINEKTDILVSYEPTGENLDSSRPKVKGLIFTIKLKEPPLKVIEPVTITEAMPESRPNELSTLYTIFTGLKFDPFARLSREAAEATIRQWVDKNGYDAVYNGLIRVKETYTGEIKNPIGFFSNSYFKENKDYLKQKGQSTNEQLKKNQDKQTVELIKSIQEDYRKRREEQLILLYNEASEEQQNMAFEIIRNAQQNMINGRNIALDTKGKINTFGVLQAGAMFAEAQKKGADYRQPRYANYVLKNHNIHIGFDHNDEVVYLKNGE